MDLLLTTDEVAATLGVARAAVAYWCRHGLLPGAHAAPYRSGLRWLIPAVALDGFAPPKVGHPKGARRSAARILIRRRMQDGQARTVAELCKELKCSDQLVRLYLKEMGAVRCPERGFWRVPSGSECNQT